VAVGGTGVAVGAGVGDGRGVAVAVGGTGVAVAVGGAGVKVGTFVLVGVGLGVALAGAQPPKINNVSAKMAARLAAKTSQPRTFRWIGFCCMDSSHRYAFQVSRPHRPRWLR
jgi:hypothetical protein